MGLLLWSLAHGVYLVYNRIVFMSMDPQPTGSLAIFAILALVCFALPLVFMVFILTRRRSRQILLGGTSSDSSGAQQPTHIDAKLSGGGASVAPTGGVGANQAKTRGIIAVLLGMCLSIMVLFALSGKPSQQYSVLYSLFVLVGLPLGWLLPVIGSYFVLKDKGYNAIWSLVALLVFVGPIIILALPNKGEKQGGQT